MFQISWDDFYQNKTPAGNSWVAKGLLDNCTNDDMLPKCLNSISRSIFHRFWQLYTANLEVASFRNLLEGSQGLNNRKIKQIHNEMIIRWGHRDGDATAYTANG
jgi:hypothetical protein